MHTYTHIHTHIHTPMETVAPAAAITVNTSEGKSLCSCVSIRLPAHDPTWGAGKDLNGLGKRGIMDWEEGHHGVGKRGIMGWGGGHNGCVMIMDLHCESQHWQSDA